ncbi:Stf0 family sulfotransferase [Methylobacterium sp. sgz302541]|uniref:Stf0 family sulfotransferase n=1 Tax=unclassified Methylobacterium TaxID=2615210 RepID=UPI003D352B95
MTFLSRLLRRPTPAVQPSKPDLRGYAVCTLPRSGSNFFCDVLGSTGVLGHPREYFNGVARRGYDDPTYPDDPHEQIARILTMGATPNGIYALKIFPGLHDVVAPHLRWTEVLPNLKFVRFRRRDILGQAISWVRAAQTQRFRITDPGHGEPVYDAEAIGLRVRQICQRGARWDMFFARTGLPAIEIVYETFLDDPDAGVNGVARWLDLPGDLHVDIAQSRFRMQRDDVNAAWRARFVAEQGDPNFVDPV